MSVSGYYGRDQIIMGDVRTDNAYSNMNSGRFANSDMDYSQQDLDHGVRFIESLLLLIL